jgi:hypothetical protein
VVAKDTETLVLVSLLRRQKSQLLPSLTKSSGNATRTCSCYVNTVTSTTPSLKVLAMVCHAVSGLCPSSCGYTNITTWLVSASRSIGAGLVGPLRPLS